MISSAETQAKTTAAGLSRYLWLLWVLWLAFLIYPLSSLFHAHPSPLRLSLVLPAAALFAVIYSWNVWRNLERVRTGGPASSPWPAIAVLVAIALALNLADSRNWIELFIFIGVSMGPSLPTGQGVRAVGVVLLLMLALGLATGFGVGPTAQFVLQTAVSSFAVIIVVRTVMLERELRLAREEIVRLAVSEERLRFARDLHDLLGHSLSLIALKSELAGRLIPAAPERAASEIADVESVAREALAEVREAVAGYRQPTLQSELNNAREILQAAGITPQVEGSLDTLPSALEAVLSWAVREGVTNVIRHSRAHHCIIRLRHDASEVAVEVTDDGAGPPADDTPGSGLSGLRERVAASGGRLEAGPRAEGGFRLSVAVPLAGSAAQPGRERPDEVTRSA